MNMRRHKRENGENTILYILKHTVFKDENIEKLPMLLMYHGRNGESSNYLDTLGLFLDLVPSINYLGMNDTDNEEKEFFKIKEPQKNHMYTIDFKGEYLYCSMSCFESMIDTIQDIFTKAIGIADIVISNSVDFFYNEDDVKLSEVTIENKLSVLNYYGKYKLESGKKKRVLFYGTDVKNRREDEIEDLNKYEIIVSNAFAQSENLALGDKLKITVDNKEYEFMITKLAYSTGIYTDETESIVMSISAETAMDMLGLPDDKIITAMYIDAGDEDSEDAICFYRANYSKIYRTCLSMN